MRPEKADGGADVKLREGDIFRWRWRDDERHNDCAPYRSYHCYSRIALVEDGHLHDTFWSSGGSDRWLDPEKVILTPWANVADLTEIRAYDIPYYRPDDIVDLRHSNNSRGPIYRRTEAKRDAETMADEVRQRAGEARRTIESATRDLERWAKAEAMIESGLIDEVYL